MLQALKFQKKKVIPINNFHNVFKAIPKEYHLETIYNYIDYVNQYYDHVFYTTNINYIHQKNASVATNRPYKIIKEHHTESWMFVYPYMITLFISTNDINLFIDKIKDSNYKFYVFETSQFYIAVCVSHFKNPKVDWIPFLYEHHCNKTYIVMSEIFGSLLFLNTGFQESGKHALRLHTITGQGTAKHELKKNLEIYLSFQKEYHTFLPKHFVYLGVMEEDE